MALATLETLDFRLQLEEYMGRFPLCDLKSPKLGKTRKILPVGAAGANVHTRIRNRPVYSPSAGSCADS